MLYLKTEQKEKRNLLSRKAHVIYAADGTLHTTIFTHDVEASILFGQKAAQLAN